MLRPSTFVVFFAVLCVFCAGVASAERLEDGLPPDSLRISSDSSQIPFAAPASNQDYMPKWYDMISNLPGDWLRYSDQTFRTENIPVFIGIAASTTALIITDDVTWDKSRRWFWGSQSVQDWSHAGEWIGDGRPQFGLAGAFALYGWVGGDRRALRTGSELVEGILACGGVVQLLKHVTGRQSPYVSSEPRGEWVFFPNQVDYANHVPFYDAFPSGHLSTAIATLTIVAENYPECWWIRPIGYPAMAWLAMSMVNTGIHWYSDYPLAISMGYVFGKLVAHPPEVALAKSTSENDTPPPSLSMSPGITRRGPGLEFALTF